MKNWDIVAVIAAGVFACSTIVLTPLYVVERQTSQNYKALYESTVQQYNDLSAQYEEVSAALEEATSGGSGAATARIWLDGELYEEIELSAVVLPREFDITTELGTNRVRVERGAISVVSADCPDQTCVRMGRISGEMQTIACIPHRLVIDIVTEAGQ